MDDTEKTKELFKTKSEKGFDMYDFMDTSDQECSLQKSSDAITPKIWLGVDYSPHTQKQARMHLDQLQAKALIPILQRFVDTGEIA